MKTQFDVIIVGAGVTGTADAYLLSRYTNVRRIAVIEKYSDVAQVNSNPMNNAQTSHDGGTETNYDLPHALQVKRAATPLRTYVERRKAPGLFRKTTRMALAVGKKEVTELRERHRVFASSYPDLKLVEADELGTIEPMVMKGRNPQEKVLAEVSDQGYAINYQLLAECFVEDAQAANPDLKLFFDTAVISLRGEEGCYVLETSKGVMTAKTVIFAAGAYSLHFAHKLGIGLEYAILSVAGSFYSSGPFLNGKVYRMQIPGMPFAAIHGDPDVLNSNDTRFGPTTKPIPLMERHKLGTFWDFARIGWVSVRGFISALRILADRQLLGYVMKNWLYDLPVLGRLLFLQEARVIVPSLRYRDLKLRKGAGGVRPQIVNLVTHQLEMGDKTLTGDRIIFNTTPSPGASVCLANAERDVPRIVEMLGSEFSFDRAAFERDHGLMPDLAPALA